jgi:hypothetical protein
MLTLNAADHFATPTARFLQICGKRLDFPPCSQQTAIAEPSHHLAGVQRN